MKVKQQYEAPELVQLGAVEDLTQGSRSGYIDGLIGGPGGCRGGRLKGCFGKPPGGSVS